VDNIIIIVHQTFMYDSNFVYIFEIEHDPNLCFI